MEKKKDGSVSIFRSTALHMNFAHIIFRVLIPFLENLGRHIFVFLTNIMLSAVVTKIAVLY